jgi:uncharacterized protein involved in outer membrane biogenesis
MKKAVMIVGAVVAVVVIVIAAVLLYAARNLNSIIAERQAYLLQRVSDALDRKVEVSTIKVTLGWGLMADLTGVKIEDDPALSDRPFIEANDAYAKVDLMPLLSRRVHVTEVTLKNPEVHIIRTEQGGFNVTTIGKKHRGNEEQPSDKPRTDAIEGAPITSERGNAQTPAKKSSRDNLAAIYVKSLVIDNGVIVYEERGPNHQMVTIGNVDIVVKDFGFTRVFDLSLKLAMLSDKQNVDISGTLGPLASEGALDIKNAHFTIEAKVGPLELARLRAIGSLGKAIPEALSLPDPVSLEARADGTPSAIKFHVESDLSSNRVAWANSFDKPASATLKLDADGSRSDADMEIAQANLKLGDLEANLHHIEFGGGKLSARLDTNRFDIGAMAKMLPMLQKYDASGHGEIHSDVLVANKQPRAHGTINLADVSLSRPDDKKTLFNNLAGNIKLNGNAADAGPLKFDLGGSSHATATLHANSLQPLNANYAINLDTIKVADFAPSRPSDEHLNNLAMNGTVVQGEEIAVNVKASSSEGDLANIAYKDLNLAATMLGKQLNVQSLKLGAFNGMIAASGNASLGDAPQFALNMTANNVDIQSALKSQQSKSADLIQGILDAQLQVSGRGAKFDDIKPTLAGNGRAAVRNGKLIGINLAADALNKTKGLPQIGDLVPASLVQRHPELFSNPDTDINNASLSFVLQGPRITTHDLIVQTPDYGMTGDGWFDMDKNIEMAARLLLTKQLTSEIIAEKKNVVYVTNRDGQVDIPMVVRGKLPKPAVLPDIGELAQRAGTHALQQNLGKLLGKKGKGLNIPFLSNGGGGNAPSGGNNSNPSNNPLDQLKGLFH